jgi:uncharacterized protein (DUF736 family)
LRPQFWVKIKQSRCSKAWIKRVEITKRFVILALSRPVFAHKAGSALLFCDNSHYFCEFIASDFSTSGKSKTGHLWPCSIRMEQQDR